MAIMTTFDDIDAQIPEREYESGYLKILTTYTPDDQSREGGEAEANALIARSVRKIVEARDGCVNGAVVEENSNGDPKIYVIVSVKLFKEDEEDEPLEDVAGEILEVLGSEIAAASDIKVDDVTPVKEVKTQTPTGLQGLP